nr:GNAT family N-acetyltransferase [Cohnella zeiphila]
MDLAALQKLLRESEEEGHRHIRRLIRDYESGANRFDKSGEALWTASVGETTVGVCGLNRDPYSAADGIGRLRRMYVMRDFRRRGVGSALVREAIREARKHYGSLALKTDNPAADSFYQSLGFQELPPDPNASATHLMVLEEP